MKNLTPRPLTVVELYLHALSSLVALDGERTVVVNVAKLERFVDSDMAITDQFAEEVAAGCSKKFYRNHYQRYYDWHVSYNAELKCFVAVRRSHPDLRN